VAARWPTGPLPDYLVPGLRLVIVGFNPGTRSAALGHYYAHPGSVFWRLLADAGLVPRALTAGDDALLPGFGIGITDVVKRSTPGAGDLRPGELRAGGAIVRDKLAYVRPRAAAYTGKGVYRAVAGVAEVPYGRQRANVVAGVADFVLPSPSGRSGLPYAEKLRWWTDLTAFLAGVD
jgi:mismatch-specific thymine-DNA glycosylase